MTYLVFGGRSPIALALCRELAIKGQRTSLVTRRIDHEVKEQARLYGVDELHECDLASAADALDLVRGIDSASGSLEGLAFVHRYRGPADPATQHAVEVTTPYQILQMLADDKVLTRCSVVMTTSPAARSVLLDQDFHYHASKAAISALVRYGAVHFADKGLRINGVSPGSFVYKERAANFYKANPNIAVAVREYVPLSRMATVDDIARVMGFLLSSESEYVNGQVIEVDGGVACIDSASIARDAVVASARDKNDS